MQAKLYSARQNFHYEQSDLPKDLPTLERGARDPTQASSLGGHPEKCHEEPSWVHRKENASTKVEQKVSELATRTSTCS
jgi:hypothetical protein